MDHRLVKIYEFISKGLNHNSKETKFLSLLIVYFDFFLKIFLYLEISCKIISEQDLKKMSKFTINNKDLLFLCCCY